MRIGYNRLSGKEPSKAEKRLATTLSSKGQLTVPAWIVHRVGLLNGDKLEVTVLDEDTFLARKVSGPVVRPGSLS